MRVQLRNWNQPDVKVSLCVGLVHSHHQGRHLYAARIVRHLVDNTPAEFQSFHPSDASTLKDPAAAPGQNSLLMCAEQEGFRDCEYATGKQSMVKSQDWGNKAILQAKWWWQTCKSCRSFCRSEETALHGAMEAPKNRKSHKICQISSSCVDFVYALQRSIVEMRGYLNTINLHQWSLMECTDFVSLLIKELTRTWLSAKNHF